MTLVILVCACLSIVAQCVQVARRTFIWHQIGGVIASPAITRAAGEAQTASISSPTSVEATVADLALLRGHVSVPGSWRETQGVLVDPILGDIAKSIDVHLVPCKQSSIADFGKIDTFQLADLGLAPGRDRGDIVSARRRTDDNGRIYYEWDLAISPESCPREQQLVVTTCLPSEVALVSATVADGQLVVYECAVSPPQWKNFAKALRSVRSSFAV